MSRTRTPTPTPEPEPAQPREAAGRFGHTIPGRTGRVHALNMTPAAHQALAAMTAVERGDLIMAALEPSEG